MRSRLLTLLSVLLFVTSASSLVFGGRLSGQLRQLNGGLGSEGLGGIRIQATSTDAAATPIEATTDEQGQYSFNVGADGTYSLSVVADGTTNGVVRATPDSISVAVTGGADVSSIDFIAFRRPAKFDITGEIVGLKDGKHLATLEVQLALASNPGAVVAKTNTLGQSTYFEFLNLQPETYILSVKTSLSTRTYSFTSPSLTISLASSIHVKPVVEISYKMSSVHEMQTNSVWNTLIVMAIIVAIIYKDQSLTLARAALKSAQTRNPSHLRNALASLTSSSSTTPAATNEEKPTAKKPKYPSKKEKTHISTFVRYDSLPSPPVVDTPAPLPAPVPAPAPVVRESKPEPVKVESKKRVQTPAPSPSPSPAPTPVVDQPTPAKSKSTPAPKAKGAPKSTPPPAKESPAPAVTQPAAPVVAPTPTTTTNAARFCSGCGNKRPDMNARFCSNCGEKY